MEVEEVVVDGDVETVVDKEDAVEERLVDLEAENDCVMVVVMRTGVAEEEAVDVEVLLVLLEGVVKAGAKIESIRLAMIGPSPPISTLGCRLVEVRSKFSSAGSWRRLLGSLVAAAARPRSVEMAARRIEKRITPDDVSL